MTAWQYYIETGYLVIGFDSPRSLGDIVTWTNLPELNKYKWAIWKGSNFLEAQLQAEALNINVTSNGSTKSWYPYIYQVGRMEEIEEKDKILQGDTLVHNEALVNAI